MPGETRQLDEARGAIVRPDFARFGSSQELIHVASMPRAMRRSAARNGDLRRKKAHLACLAAGIYPASGGMGMVSPRFTRPSTTLVVNRFTFGFSLTRRDIKASKAAVSGAV